MVDPIDLARRRASRGGSLTRAEEEAMYEWGPAELRAYIGETLRWGPAEAPPPWPTELALIAAGALGSAMFVPTLRGWRDDPARLMLLGPACAAAVLYAEARQRAERQEARRRGMTRAGDGPLRPIPRFAPVLAVGAGSSAMASYLRRAGRMPPEDAVGWIAGWIAVGLLQAVQRRMHWHVHRGPKRRS